jgi:hypothetical protein
MIVLGWMRMAIPEASAWRISSLELDPRPGLLVESVVCSRKYKNKSQRAYLDGRLVLSGDQTGSLSHQEQATSRPMRPIQSQLRKQ